MLQRMGQPFHKMQDMVHTIIIFYPQWEEESHIVHEKTQTKLEDLSKFAKDVARSTQWPLFTIIV